MQARSDIDGVAEQIAAWRFGDFAQMHAQAKLGFLLHLAERYGRVERVGCAGEFEHEPVASGVEDAAVVFGGDASRVGAHTCDVAKRFGCVAFGKRGKAGDIDGYDGRVFAGRFSHGCLHVAHTGGRGALNARHAARKTARIWGRAP